MAHWRGDDEAKEVASQGNGVERKKAKNDRGERRRGVRRCERRKDNREQGEKEGMAEKRMKEEATDKMVGGRRRVQGKGNVLPRSSA